MSGEGILTRAAKWAYMKYYSNPTVQRVLVNQFTRLYYQTPVPVRTWHKTHWLGAQVLKCPFDLWNYQELITELKPDLVIESGTASGGSALFLASILQLTGNGKVISIDVNKAPSLPAHPRIEYLTGSSTSDEILAYLESQVRASHTVMVILDSDHRLDHVSRELELYSKFVTLHSYLIVEDTCINGHPVAPQFGPGPMEAVRGFLRKNSEFQADSRDRKFLMTFNPKGYLLRVRAHSL